MSAPSLTGRNPVTRTAGRGWRIRLDGRDLHRNDREVPLAASPHPVLSWRSDETAEVVSSRIVIVGDGYHWERTVGGPDRSCTVEAPLPSHGDLTCTLEFVFADDKREAVTSRFGTGAFRAEEWVARWRQVPAGTGISAGLPSGIDRLWLTVAARGVVRISVDGTVVNQGRLDTSRTDAERAMYRAFDVTDLAGEILTIVSGSGSWGAAGHDPELLCEILAEDADGVRRLDIGDSARRHRSEIVVDDPFYLETHDSARTEALDQPLPAPRADSFGVLMADAMPAVRTTQNFEGVPVAPADDSARVFDVGTNIAGRSRIRLLSPVPPGTVVEVQHGEMLDGDGNVDTTNITMPFDHGRPRQVLRHIVREGDEIIEPWFAYYGFRFIEVRGLPSDAEIEVSASAIHTDLIPAAEVDTRSPEITALLERGRRTLLNNVHSIPEDCPTREQSGWTGDVASSAEWILNEVDAEAFLSKWLDDVASSQQQDGAIPAVVPDTRSSRMPSDPVWGSVLPRLLLGHWLHYGDRRVVERLLPALRSWAGFLLRARDDRGIVSGAPTSYGHDWLGLVQTPPTLLHTAAAIECLDTLARLEQEFSGENESTHWRRQAAALRSAATAVFWDPTTSTVGNGAQGAIAMAIQTGIVPSDSHEALVGKIVDDVRARGNRPSGGFATIRAIVQTLQDHGRSDVVFDMLRQREQPGIGAMLCEGPGTFWETWSIDPGNTGTGSLDHVGLGGPFAAWVHTGLAGIVPTAPGFREFRVAPAYVPGIGPFTDRLTTPLGTIRVSTEQVDDWFQIEVVVPAGASAVILPPGGRPRSVGAGVHALRTPALPVPANREVPASASSGLTGPGDVVLDIPPVPSHGAASVVSVPPLDCTPIPHEQLRSGVHLVTGREGATGVDASLHFNRPVDLGEAAYLFALIDRCWLDSTHEQELVIRAVSASGSVLTGTSRYWPSGWNRVAVDLHGWPGRHALARIEVGLRPTGRQADNAITAEHVDASETVSYRLGTIGYSTSPRTW